MMQMIKRLIMGKKLYEFILSAKEKQKKEDEKEYEKKLSLELERAEDQKAYELAEKDAIIEMLAKQIKEWERKESVIYKREQENRKMIKENRRIGISLFTHFDNMQKALATESYAIKGELDDIEVHVRQLTGGK